jgi:hypothetical protein
MTFGSRLAAINAALLLVCLPIGAAAAAPVHCGSAASLHGVSTARPAVRPCPHVRGQLRARAPAKAQAAGDLGELTPLAGSGAPPARSGWPAAWLTAVSRAVLALPSLRAEAQGSRARLSAGQLPLDRGPVSANIGDVRRSLGDAMGGAVDARPIFSAPIGWSVLLLGLIGLFAVMRRPRVDRVRSWAMAIPPRAVARLALRAAVLDPSDPARRAQPAGQRLHQGHFVRTARRRFAAPV